MTPAQLDLLLHATGQGERDGWLCAEPDSPFLADANALCEAGLMHYGGQPKWAGGLHYYQTTPAGTELTRQESAKRRAALGLHLWEVSFTGGQVWRIWAKSRKAAAHLLAAELINLRNFSWLQARRQLDKAGLKIRKVKP